MKHLLRYICTLSWALCLPALCYATHNRAGEIHIRQVGPLTIEATIITWTKSSSQNADRDTLSINWGDGSPMQAVARNNGNGKGVDLPNDIRYNTYVARHTYAGPAAYRISMSDPNRIAGIVNVNPPSSDNVAFHIETIYSFQDQQFGGPNTTPYLKQPPIDNACVGKVFRHNPNAFDIDKDSLSYRLITPLQSEGLPVPNYFLPSQILPGPGNSLSMDERTGDIVWNAPRLAGDYNLAFVIISWRNGAPIDTTIRDMQIFVDECKNNPPRVQTIQKICVTAGSVVSFTATATDPDSSDRVRLTALGGPFDTSLVNPAVFTVTPGYNRPPLTGTFRWQTDCTDISDQFYSVVFKATDSLTANGTRLSDLKTVQIKVVGPPPEGMAAIAEAGKTTISWNKPYYCENAKGRYFYGFSVWRREGPNPFTPDTCTPGLAGRGYTEIAFRTTQMRDGRYVFEDTKVERGRTYCYRVLAKFARLSPGGYPYNLVEGLPSAEVCVQLPRDLPIMANVSVQKTDAANGEIQVIWTKPVAKDLDTLLHPGPYRYQLLRASGANPTAFAEVNGASFVRPRFWQANDTSFTDRTLNTQSTTYYYKVAFYTGNQAQPLGFSNEASSVFLTVGATDQASELSWIQQVPWTNFRYTIYRKNPAGGFDSIGQSTVPRYTDKGLVNGVRYCYKVRTAGTYSIEGVRTPLFNDSQEACNVPIDTIPPCIPVLTVKNLCQSATPSTAPPYENRLDWNNTNDCPGSDDTKAYKIWYAPMPKSPFILLETLQGAASTTFVHVLDDNVAGCYAVSATDTVGNESRRSNVVCVDNCPEYALPNAFTPNGDGQNDLYTPFPGWRFIEKVELQILNRWGNVIFTTEDPAVNWDGTSADGKNVADGTYYYVCRVFERRVEGIVARAEVLRGYIELAR